MNRMMKKMAVVFTVATMSVAGATTAFASGAASNSPIDQYDVQVNKRYTLDSERNIEVTRVYEKEGRLWGTNRTIQWIDLDTGETGESRLGFWGNTAVYPYGTTFEVVYLDA